jgi:hypothetical protein
MKSYSLRARPKVQQCFKHVLAASEPNNKYDAVIIGGGMNVHFMNFSCVALFTEARRKMLNVHRYGVVNATDSLQSRICGQPDFPTVVNYECFPS